MKYLFSSDAKMILESFCFTSTMFAFDYDGTLSRIVRDPDLARMTRKTILLLKALDERVPVAIISGRSRTDLEHLLAYRPRYIIGNHGIEGLSKKGASLTHIREQSFLWKNTLEAKLNEKQGIFIEDKEYSVAIHYRQSREKAKARHFINELCTSLEPLPRIVAGKCVVNLVPPGGPHKGMALLDLMSECEVRNAIYIGDDHTDEDVFSLPNERLLSIRVGRKHNSAAKFFIRSQSEINQLLENMLQYLEE